MEDPIKEVDKLAATLHKLQPLKPEYQERLDKKFRLEFNYNSNHIEGNTLTYGETELLLLFDKTTGKHGMREYEEMKAHDVAYDMIREWAADNDRPLSEMDIKNLHKILLVRPFWKEAQTVDGQDTRRLIQAGSYKEQPNSVRLQNGEMFHYASPQETPALMGELIKWYRDEEGKEEIHPVALAALLHYKFVRIHPFDDGNGRLSRLLMNYVLLKNDLPPVIIKSADKKGYLFALNQADTGNINAFIDYIADQLTWSLEMKIKAAKGVSLEEDGDFLKEIKLRQQKASNMELTKSPKLVYDVYQKVEAEVWKVINETISQIKGLFTDSRTQHMVDGFDEKFDRRTTIGAMLTREVSSEPYTPKIFGYSIYENIWRITWHKTLYGLKGGKGNNDLKIILDIHFNQQSYEMELKANDMPTYKTEKKYNDLFLSDDAYKMNKVLQKHLLAEIDKRTNTNEK